MTATPTIAASSPTGRRPGRPRPYEFPAVERFTLGNGLRVLVADLPGRPLVSASLVLRNGAADEPPATPAPPCSRPGP